MTVVEDLAVDALAGYALGRLVTHDTITRRAANELFLNLCDPIIPDEAWAGFNPEVATRAAKRLSREIDKGLAIGTVDMRELHRAGWTEPFGPWSRWLADLLSCPICSSFHALWISHVLTGRARPWSPRWWVRLFAGWGGAQIAIRATAAHESVADLAAQAIMEESGAEQ